MAVRIYRVLRFNDKEAASLTDSVNNLKKFANLEPVFDQKKIKKGFIPPEYLTVKFELKDFNDLNSALQIKESVEEEEVKKTFIPKKFTGKIKHHNIWKDNDKTLIKPIDEVFGDFEIPVAFFIKDKYLHALILRADEDMVKKFKSVYVQAEEIDSTEFNNNIFNWLFYLFDKEKGVIENRNRITDMLGFRSSPSGANLNLELISGISDHVAGLDATKLEIALNHVLTSIKLTIIYNTKTFKFAIDDNLKMTIEPNYSDIGSSFSKNYTGFNNDHLYMAKGIYILCILMPYFESKFNNAQDFDEIYHSYRLGLRDGLVNKLNSVQ